MWLNSDVLSNVQFFCLWTVSGVIWCLLQYNWKENLWIEIENEDKKKWERMESKMPSEYEWNSENNGKINS